MKRSLQITGIAVFLGIIYAVPVVQTAYEYRADPGHRIQMLDLGTDLFITPLEKARATKAGVDTLAQTIDSLTRETASAKAAADDSTVSWDPQKATDLCDAASLQISLMKKNAVDYNRHVTGAANSFTAQDTLKPMYRALANAATRLDSMVPLLRSAFVDAAALEKIAFGLKADLSVAERASGDVNYAALTLTAFRRIMVGSNYLRPYETEMEKASVFAAAVRPWMLYGYYKAFGDLGSKGVRGTDGWFFYRPDVDYLIRPDVFDRRSVVVDANDVPVTDDIVGAIVDFKEQLNARGIDLLFVVMPVKPSIYPELLSPSASPGAMVTTGNSSSLLARLRMAGIETVDLFSPLRQERQRDAACGDFLYLRGDTHFKGRGVLAAARAVAERVKKYPWYAAGKTEYAVDTVVIPRYGDVGEMVGLPARVVAKREYPFSAESTACYQVSRIERDATGAAAGKHLYKDDYRNSAILVLGDSYSRIFQTDQPKSAGWIAHLAAELSQPVASLVNDGGASTLVRQTLARKPGLLRNKKLVIWEVVERDFRFGAEGWKRVEIPKDNTSSSRLSIEQ